ncbi:hypothetical protein [Streptomyces sp. NPDC056987]|uniref:hypothetical protein n=1 Tax=Streptomyces sp. NPDC056987 TaxID=3345988 RepID=UPI003626C02A
MVEQFAAAGCPEVTEATRANYRACLTAIRTAVFGPDLPGGRPVPLSESDPSQPYSPNDKAALWAWAGGQPTDELRRGLRLLLALGLDTNETIPLRGPDVRVLSDGSCVSTVRGARTRLIICSRPYERTLARPPNTPAPATSSAPPASPGPATPSPTSSTAPPTTRAHPAWSWAAAAPPGSSSA